MQPGSTGGKLASSGDPASHGGPKMVSCALHPWVTWQVPTATGTRRKARKRDLRPGPCRREEPKPPHPCSQKD